MWDRTAPGPSFFAVLAATQGAMVHAAKLEGRSMDQPSITSGDSFARRAQRSEAHRVVLWLVVLAGMLVLTLVRRWVGGRVMTDNRLFFPYAGALVAGIAGELAVLRVVRAANRAGRLLPAWLWRGAAVFDLAAAASLLVVASFLS